MPKTLYRPRNLSQTLCPKRYKAYALTNIGVSNAGERAVVVANPALRPHPALQGAFAQAWPSAGGRLARTCRHGFVDQGNDVAAIVCGVSDPLISPVPAVWRVCQNVFVIIWRFRWRTVGMDLLGVARL